MAFGGSASLPMDPKDIAAEGGPKTAKAHLMPLTIPHLLPKTCLVPEGLLSVDHMAAS